MNTCFIFADSLDDNSAFCLVLDEDGNITAPLSMRTFDEIQIIQANAITTVILPTRVVTLHRLELPWLSESKARTAIPYALEEQLAQNVNTLHFAFDKSYHKNQH